MVSYILNTSGRPVARLLVPAQSGMLLRYGHQTCRESIDANRSVSLVNDRMGKVSNAKKWRAMESRLDAFPVAREVYPGNFLIS